MEIDKPLSKECLKLAWKETLPMDITTLPNSRRRIIDFAHRIDPEFASSLASESDDDPGRELAREQAKQRLELLKRRERVYSGENDALKPDQNDVECIEFAKMMLSGLNSNRINSFHIDFTRQHIKKASQMNLKDAYEVLSWVIENAVRRYSDTDQAKSLLRPLYEASRLSTELAFRIAARIQSITDSGISAARHTAASENSLIHNGEREKALTFIKDFVSKATDFIIITDPYFGLEELEFVKLIRGENLIIPIFILTSRKHQQDTRIQQPWDETYQSYWRMNISDSDPGEVTVIMIGNVKTGSHPIHDRWCLSENSGLRIGTSVKSLGSGRITEISPISKTESVPLIAELNRYIYGKGNLIHGGDLLRLSSFRL